LTEYTYNVHGIFSLKSNTTYFEGMLHAFKTDKERRSALNFEFRMDPDLRISREGKERINIMFYHDQVDNSIEVDYPWVRPICAKLVFSDEERNCLFLFNGNYMKVSRLVGGCWRLISIMRALLQMNLIRSNMILVHGGVVRIGGQGILIPGVENTGKTTTVWSLAKNGAQFVTDEYSIFDEDGQSYGIPGNSSLTKTTARAIGLKFRRSERVLLTLADIKGKVLTIHLSSGATSVPPERFFKICGKTLVSASTIIQNGIDSTKRIGFEEALARIKAIQLFEFGWRNHPFLLAYSFFNPTFDLTRLYSREDDILALVLTKIQRFYLVSSSKRDHNKAIESIAKTHVEQYLSYSQGQPIDS